MSRKPWALVALVSVACHSSEDDVAYDLAALVSEALVVREREGVDFGSPDTRALLYDGWSRDETAAGGTSFVWSNGPTSTLRLFFAESRDVHLSFRCWAFPYPGAPAQALTVEVNGLELETLALEERPAEYRVVLPSGAVESGANQLSFRYAWHRAPRDVIAGATDARSLAVGWDWLRIENALVADEPQAKDARLDLPEHIRLEYFLELSPDDALHVDRIDGSGSLGVVVETLEGARTESFGVGESVALSLDGSGLARIALEARGGAVALSSARVLRARGGVASALRPPARPNILLYVADTLRADYLGAYGYVESPSPRLDAFAREATVFTRALAQSSWTKSSMASVFTGLTPLRHGANERDSVLPAVLSTLPERVQGLGYETAGFVTNPNLTEVFGFAQGFDVYEFLTEEDPERAYVRSDVLTDRAIDWLSTRRSDDPFFVYLHSMDPHDPYLGSSGGEIGSMAFMSALEEGRATASDGVKSRLRELYLAEIRFNDEHFGRLLDGLRELELYEETLIVFVSDHGEEFSDHGWWRHGKTLYQEQLHVPMIVKWPGEAEPRRVETVAQQVDIVPTLLDYLGEPAEGSLSGRSLLPVVEGREMQTLPPLTSYLSLDGRHVESVVLDDTKLIRYLAYDRATPAIQVFRLDTDPGEKHDLREEKDSVRDLLDGLLTYRRATARAPEAEPADIDPELYQKLRALGYVK